jgi:hypothetical protein
LQRQLIQPEVPPMLPQSGSTESKKTSTEKPVVKGSGKLLLIKERKSSYRDKGQ